MSLASSDLLSTMVHGQAVHIMTYQSPIERARPIRHEDALSNTVGLIPGNIHLSTQYMAYMAFEKYSF
jgi:hypothetical protein